MSKTRLLVAAILIGNAVIAGLPLFAITNWIIWGYTGHTLTPKDWWSGERVVTAIALAIAYFPVYMLTCETFADMELDKRMTQIRARRVRS